VVGFIEHGIGLDFPNTDHKIRFVGTTPLFVNQTFPNSTLPSSLRQQIGISCVFIA